MLEAYLVPVYEYKHITSFDLVVRLFLTLQRGENHLITYLCGVSQRHRVYFRTKNT